MRRKRICLVVVALLVALGVGSMVLWAVFRSDVPGGPAGYESYSIEVRRAVGDPLNRQSISRLYRALALYDAEHGTIPFSEKGAEYALYELKPYLGRVPTYPTLGGDDVRALDFDHGDVTAFDLPFTGLSNGPARWDDQNQRVLNVDFEYLNEEYALDRRRADRAVLEEKPSALSEGRWVVFSNGAAAWLVSELHREVLGKSWEDLGVHRYRAPLSRLEMAIPVEETRHLLWLTVVVHAYASEHGATPFSEKGADYALYKLKPYMPDAAGFDVLYAPWENGVAFWDDEEQRLVNGDYEYLNKPIPPGPPYELAEPVALLAEKWGAGPTQFERRVLFGDSRWRDIGVWHEHGEDPLGRTYEEIVGKDRAASRPLPPSDPAE